MSGTPPIPHLLEPRHFLGRYPAVRRARQADTTKLALSNQSIHELTRDSEHPPYLCRRQSCARDDAERYRPLPDRIFQLAGYSRDFGGRLDRQCGQPGHASNDTT